MNEITKEDIKSCIEKMGTAFSKELFDKTQSELEEYWHFKFDDTASMERNLYKFHDLLKLYGSFCRQWEEHHNGCMCVVERVRDKYLMPKIKDFISKLTVGDSNNG